MCYYICGVDMKRVRIAYIIFVLYLIILLLSASRGLYFKVDIARINIDMSQKGDTKPVVVEIAYNNFFKTECSLDNTNWKDAEFGRCSYELPEGNYTVYVKNALNETSKEFNLSINEIRSFDINITKWFLAPEETLKILNKMEYVGLPDLSLIYTSDDESVATVDSNGVITGVGNGTTKIHVKPIGFDEKVVEITTTDIIRAPELDDTKPVVKCEQYTAEEAALLDEILATRVEQRGVGTRAALLEVTRFMTLNLKVKIPYFYEHGRMKPYWKNARKVDGEGRWYHKGLYLSKDKYDLISPENVKEKKAMWGCPLTNYDDSDGWAVGAKKPNGLDCSGFVSFSLYNSGQDPGDIGAGMDPELISMDDFGEKHTLTYEFANSDNYKVGDMIGRNGHVALISGKDDENLYISESLLKGVRTVTYSYKNKNSKLYTNYEYIGNLDNRYVADGDYTDMW